MEEKKPVASPKLLTWRAEPQKTIDASGCEIEVKQVTDSEKKMINIETFSMQNPYVCVEFQRRLWTCGPKPGNIVSDHAEEFSAFLLKQASERYFWSERTGALIFDLILQTSRSSAMRVSHKPLCRGCSSRFTFSCFDRRSAQTAQHV